METNTNYTIEELTDALIEDKWILCSPGEAIQFAIGEYLDYAEKGIAYTYNDTVVPVSDFLRAIAGMAEHFVIYENWHNEPEQKVKRPLFRRARRMMANIASQPLTKRPTA